MFPEPSVMANIENFPGLKSLTQKNGLLRTPPPKMSVEQIVVCAVKSIGMQNVIAASRMNQHVIIFISKEEMVTQLVETGLSIEPDIFVFVSRWMYHRLK